MPSPTKRSRKPVSTRTASPDELTQLRGTGRQRAEAAAHQRDAAKRTRRKPSSRVAQRVASAHDFQLAGVRFHNARQVDGHWQVDVTNGTTTATLHNRYGSWMHDVNGTGTMAEPVRVASMLGMGMSQLEMCQALQDRVAREPAFQAAAAAKAVAKEQGRKAKPTTTDPAPEADTTTNQKEAHVARKPRSTSTATKPAAEKPAAASNGTARKPAFTLTKKDATAIAKELKNKTATMKEIRERYGHSDGSKVRAALREHGFSSKGEANPEGLTPTEWRAKYGTGEDNGASAAPAKRQRSKPAAKAEPEEEPEETEEEETEETPDERRKRLRRERRAAKTAAAKAPAKRRRRPKATAADPS